MRHHVTTHMLALEDLSIKEQVRGCRLLLETDRDNAYQHYVSHAYWLKPIAIIIILCVRPLVNLIAPYASPPNADPAHSPD